MYLFIYLFYYFAIIIIIIIVIIIILCEWYFLKMKSNNILWSSCSIQETTTYLNIYIILQLYYI